MASAETTVASTRPAGPSSRRAMVVDIAYARLEVLGRPALRIGHLVESIDHPYVAVDGVRRFSREAWAMALSELLSGADPRAVTLAHPTAWGIRRTSLLTEALRDALGAGVEVAAVPRAVVIAESHMEDSAQMCVVAECHDGRLDIHRLTRSDRRWSVQTTAVFDESLPDDLADEELEHLVGDAVEAVVVDGDTGDRVAATMRLFSDHTPTGRIAAVERVLLHRHGGTRLPVRPSPSAPVGPSAVWSPTRMAAIAAVPSGVVIAAVVAVMVISPWHTSSDDASASADQVAGDRAVTSAPPAPVSAEIGRVTLSVPEQWRRVSDPVDDDGAIPFTTIAARSDDRRIIMVQNAVRADSTLDSVAVSLRNRLDQRGNDVVTEFSPRTRYGDRDVIGYRETPVSGGQIRWYVVVDSALQVSIGCQDGGQGQSIDAECTAAVRSLKIAR